SPTSVARSGTVSAFAMSYVPALTRICLPALAGVRAASSSAAVVTTMLASGWTACFLLSALLASSSRTCPCPSSLLNRRRVSPSAPAARRRGVKPGSVKRPPDRGRPHSSIVTTDGSPEGLVRRRRGRASAPTAMSSADQSRYAPSWNERVSAPSRCDESAARPSVERQSAHVSPPGPSAIAMADHPPHGPYVGGAVEAPDALTVAMYMRPSSPVHSTWVPPSAATEMSRGVQPGRPVTASATADSRPEGPRNSSVERPSPDCQRTRVRPSPASAIATAVHAADAYRKGPPVHEPAASRVPIDIQSPSTARTRLPPDD